MGAYTGLIMTFLAAEAAAAFLVRPPTTRATRTRIPMPPFSSTFHHRHHWLHHRRCPQQGRTVVFSAVEETQGNAHDFEEENNNEDSDRSVTNTTTISGMERAWRYAKKPLLCIGSKGASLTHGNSLRQLLDHHTVVKVKVNTRQFENSLEQAFVELRALAEENGAPSGIEMLQIREADNIILFGWPGTRKRIEQGKFPLPAPSIPSSDDPDYRNKEP